MKISINKTALLALGIIGFVGLVIYSKPKNNTQNTADNTATIDDHHNSPAGQSSGASLNDLVGKPVPPFSLADRQGKIYSPENLKGKNALLFLNEGLMCYPACWDQISAFAKDARFKDADTVVLSVVVDSPQEWQKAIDEMPELAQATVVFDKGALFSKTLGALTTASSMHYGALPGHTYILIDKSGIVRYVFDDPNMGVRNDELVKKIAELKSS